MDKAYKNLGYFFLLLIPLTIAAFSKTYIVQFPTFKENITLFTHIHALLATMWLAILIVQPFLVANNKFELHKKIGRLSYVIFPLLVLSFVPQIVKNIHSAQPRNAFFPIADSTLLIVFYCLALYYKNISSKHMRYMIALALVFLGPTIGRIGPIFFGWNERVTQNVQYLIVYSILLALLFYDKQYGKKFQPYLIAIFFFAIHQVVFHILFL